MSDQVGEVRDALRAPARRAEALRRLARASTPDSLRIALLPELVRLVAYRHSDYEAAVSAVVRLPSSSLDSVLWQEMVAYLDGSESEPFLHFAQLLEQLGRQADLQQLVQRARTFEDFDIQEVADDFG